MPIKPENKDLYPPDWTYVRKRILERDKHRCCGCGLRDHSVGYRDEFGVFIPAGGNLVLEDYGQGVNPGTGHELTYKEASQIAERLTDDSWNDHKYIVIILTIAHLDHTPENCANDNLVSLCQRCHNIYDRPHRNETMRLTHMIGQLKLQFA
jgi:hypothetical protein